MENRLLPGGAKGVLRACNVWLNRVTGYDECERLRATALDHDAVFRGSRRALVAARSRFSTAISERSACQKELNHLLQRKHLWRDEELGRFTELYRSEMRLEAEEQRTKTENDRLEAEVDGAHVGLMEAMRERYQQEQLWSDKIRRASTF